MTEARLPHLTSSSTPAHTHTATAPATMTTFEYSFRNHPAMSSSQSGVLNTLPFTYLLILASSKPTLFKMWRSKERLARGQQYLPPHRQRLINSLAISYSKFVQELQAIVNKQHTGAKSWQDIMDLAKQFDNPDEFHTARAPRPHENAQSFYLSSIHPWMLEAMLTGQVAMKYHNDENFEAIISRVHGLGGFAATYVNIPCRVRHSRMDRRTQEPGSSNSSQRNVWAGFGLSPHQLEIVCGSMLDYVNLLTHSTEKLAKIRAIDEAYPPLHGTKLHVPVEGRPSSRLYLPTQRSIGMIQLLATRIRHIVEKARTQMTQEEFLEPFPWCFAEAGFGIHGEKRNRDHHYHDGTNYLFGLLTAIIRVEWPDDFEILGLTVNIVVHPTHANGAEGIASILNGTYLLQDDPNWTGLNPTLAGGLKIKMYSEPKFMIHFRAARARVAKVVDYKHHSEKEAKKLQKLVDVRGKYNEIDSLREKTEKLEIEIAEAYKEKLTVLYETRIPLRTINIEMQALLEKRKIRQNQISVPSLQRDESAEDLVEETSDIEISTPTELSSRQIDSVYFATTPTQKRSSPFSEMMPPPKVVRQNSMTSPRVTELDSSPN
jgi:hypothetical protein